VLKDVAGTKVYEDHRNESLKIIDETEQKRQKINELLSYIEERLAELEEEKEELRVYHEADRDRRLIEFVILNKEQQEISKQVEQVQILDEFESRQKEREMKRGCRMRNISLKRKKKMQ
jgi:structural maintenance of chromosome 3 (chondroitin sulfate proteoglycan 6)